MYSMKLDLKSLVLLLLLLFSSLLYSQDEDEVVLDYKMQDILEFVYELPPLEELVARAREESNLIKSREALILVKQNELAKIRHDWLDILSFKGNVGYGNGFIDVSQSNIADGIISNVNTVRFNIGLAVNLSPSYWVERKHEIKIRKAQLIYEKAMRDESTLIVLDKVTSAYLTLEYYRDIFIKSNAGFESNRFTLKLAQKKFLEGDIDIAMYNDIQLKNTKLQLEIEGYKLNLKKAYYDLESLLGSRLLRNEN
jgi:outer membrane protein TolC